MRPLAALTAPVARGLVGLLFDLDDTVLTHGLLTREAYDAIWNLHEAGLHLVAVTGRPSGWGEVIARQWPINGAVTENGAVHVMREGKGVRVLVDGTEGEVGERRSRLEALVRKVAKAMPAVHLADDNHARRSDVTWDIGENDRLEPAVVAELTSHVLRAGARTTRSSVHLHASFERDDKASGAMRFVHARFGDDVGSAIHRWGFVGDSGNDAACFAAFATTFGVANVRGYARSMSVPPRWISPSERGAGFAEIAKVLVDARR
jgi:HAD superfamily hydrolase (TIGR01484 family)